MFHISTKASFFLLVTAFLSHSGCGKRADPLAPYVKTPQPSTGLEVSQVGEEIELRVTAPRATTENRPLPVIALEWLQAPAVGDFGRSAVSILREDVAPGEARTKRFARPLTEARFAVRASNGKAESALGSVAIFKPAPVPVAPLSLQAANSALGVELRWTNPPGAEPWPSPSPSPATASVPNPSPGMSGGKAPEANTPSPPAAPSIQSTPSPTPSPTGQVVGESAQRSAPPSAPIASPTPTPTPAPPTGIRIFRTDGVARLAREPLQASSWTDLTPRPGETPCYSIRFATSFKPLVESAPTEPVCVETKDIVPPAPPGRLVGDLGTTFVELSWTASASIDVAFYRIYRTLGIGARAMAIETQGPVLRIRDPNMARGPRAYEVAAVDKGGNESAPSATFKLVLP